jgi:serine protease Do
MITRIHSKFLTIGLVSLGLATGCSRGMAAKVQPEPANEPAHSPAAAVPVQVLPSPALTQAGGASIADITERALPSVVNIALTKVGRSQAPQGFPFFFGPPQDRVEQGMGSGVIVSADGTILTNNHVVSEATEIKVTTYDRREFTAKVVGTDPKSDLAVIKVQGDVTGLKPIPFGDSSRLRLGDVVLAIGNPFGVGQTVTMGIVSAKGRADLGIVDYEDFIQTDAAINPGNSGGALVNMEGQLVGINTAILSRSGGSQGIGFAIPTNMAQPIMESLKKDGRVVRGWLGVGIQEVDAELASAMKLPVASGVVLSDVRAGTPAAQAGLKRGDVVVKLDGRPVTSAGQFRNTVASTGAKHRVMLDIYREGKLQTVGVELGEMPNEGALAGGGSQMPSPNGNTSVLDGISLEVITPAHRRAFDIPSEVQQGMVVTGVDPRSAAARAGLRPGDVLLEVDRKPVTTPKQLQDAYTKAKGNVLLLVNRRGSTVYVVVRR